MSTSCHDFSPKLNYGYDMLRLHSPSTAYANLKLTAYLWASPVHLYVDMIISYVWHWHLHLNKRKNYAIDIFFCFGCVWGRAQSQPTYPTCGKANIPQLPSEAKIMLLPESLSVRPWK